MKPLPLIPCLGLLLAGTAAAADDAGAVVRFSNNDRLSGSLESLSADTLVWRSPVLEKPTPFFLRNVMDVSLLSIQPDSTAEHEATLKLTNGDSICGQLASVTDESVALDTWFAGRLNFNRLMVTGVKIAGKASFLYRGPNGLDGWKQAGGKPGDPPAWSYSGAAFRSNAPGSIARDDLLPESCAVSFDVAWKGDAITLKVNLFSNDPSSDGSTSGYEIVFQRGNIYLRNCKTQSFIGSTNSQALMENDRAHIEIRASLKSGKVCLMVNDRVIEIWTDPDIAKGKFGRSLHFVSQTPSALRISGIGVAPWDGVMERLPEPRIGMLRQFGLQGLADEAKPPVKEKPKEGRMELANGDSLDGEVTSIADGIIAVKTPLGDVKLPVARIRNVALKKVDLERCKRRNGDIRAWFADGTSIVFRLDGVGDGTLLGSSQNFGKATFKTAAFNRIEFNIHDPDLEDKRAPGEW
jgi:hypothetical protein